MTVKADTEFLDTQRDALLGSLREHAARVAELQAEVDALADPELGSEAQADGELGDGDATATAREHLQLSARLEDEAVEAARQALARLDAGTYGTCTSCGTAIARERLEALPETPVCVVCKAGRALVR
jgi:RNA polymerase-binding transcription factor DksA